MLLELDEQDLRNMVSGMVPLPSQAEDVDIAYYGYFSGPAFSQRNDIWYWENHGGLKKANMETLLRMYRVMKGLELAIFPSDSTSTPSPRPPDFIAMGKPDSSTRMRLQQDGTYFIDNGMWETDYEYKDGRYFAVHYMEHINGQELFPVTEEQYKETAGHYYYRADRPWDMDEDENEIPY